MEGEYPHQRLRGEPSDRYALGPLFPLLLLGPIIGTAKALLQEVVQGAHKRGITFTTYTRQADSAVVQHLVAEAALKIDSAWFHPMRAARDVHTAAVSGDKMDDVTRARVRGECGYAAKLVREAIDSLVSVGGAIAFAEASPIQRMWRDANVASRHAMLATGPNLEIYGRALLGVEGNITPFI
jgi:3-hydroxy-9,10-secoandrosta-1,3,5(10)-triene-9,17-dione monooxygenase